MKRPGGVLVILAVLTFWAALGPGNEARAEYVFFYQTIGGWTVVCSRGIDGRQACRLSAPPPVQGEVESGAGASLVSVTGTGGGLAVGVQVRTVIDKNRSVGLAVDGNGAFETRANRYGEAYWRGRAARSLIERMKDGRRLILTYTPIAGGEAGESLSLTGFSEALAVWRQRSEALK